MTKLIGIIIVGIACIAASPSARALSVRTFLASTGSDANVCSIAAPCRTLPAAVAATALGGDVIILDSGGFGENVVITKSISVIAQPGVVARLKSTGTSAAILFNAPNGSFTLDGVGMSGHTGVYFFAGRSLDLRNTDINVIGTGVLHIAASGHLAAHNVTARNANTGFYISADISANTAYATITGSRVINHAYGVVAGPHSIVTVRNTTAAGNGKSTCNANFRAVTSFTNQTSLLSLVDVVSTACEAGVQAQGTGAFVSVSNSAITGNSIAGNLVDNGAGRTYSNNELLRNDTNGLVGFSAATGQ